MESSAKNSLHWGAKITQEYLESSRKYYWTPEQLSEIARYLPSTSNQTVVDVGTGLGAFAFYLKSVLPSDAQIWGIDIDKDLILRAKEIAAMKDIPVNFKVASAYDLPFSSKSVDLITEQLVLLHLASPEIAIKEIQRCLTSRGIAIFVEPNNTAVSLIDDSAKRILTTEEYLDIVSLDFAYNRGKALLGEGDSNLGDVLIGYLDGFEIIDTKLIERVDPIHPPYSANDREIMEFLYDERSYNQSSELYRRYCPAAGITEMDFQKKWKNLQKLNGIRREQMERGEYFGLHINIDYVFVCRKSS